MATNKATLKGVVTNKSDSKPIKDARVEVSDATNVKSVSTGADGSYTIDELEKKTYTLKVFVQDEERYKGDVTIDTQTRTLDIPVEIPVPTPKEPDDFDKLGETIKKIGIDAPVSINEAIQLRRLYTVGCYLLAKVPQSMPALKNDLGNNGPITGILYNDVKDITILKSISDIIEDISNKNKNDDLSMEKVLSDLREQCDLGTSTAGKVNLEFKSIFKEFVGLCTDELLAVKSADIDENKLYWDAKKIEELHKYWKKLIRVIIKFTRNMSVAGTMNPKERVLAWAKIMNNSISILDNISKLVHAPDEDEKHCWSVVAKLNNLQKSDIKAYLVQAKEGGYMLQYAIKIYEKIEADRKGNANVEDDVTYLSKLLHDKTVLELVEGKTVSEALRSIATTVWENWPPVWS